MSDREYADNLCKWIQCSFTRTHFKSAEREVAWDEWLTSLNDHARPTGSLSTKVGHYKKPRRNWKIWFPFSHPGKFFQKEFHHTYETCLKVSQTLFCSWSVFLNFLLKNGRWFCEPAENSLNKPSQLRCSTPWKDEKAMSAIIIHPYFMKRNNDIKIY